MRFLLDTHVWIWWNSDSTRISRPVRSLLLSAGNYEELLLSAISPWEFARLVVKRKLEVAVDPEEWIRQALEMPKLRLVPLSPTISYRSTTLPQPFHDDPADQIIVATAREENATILTADAKIRSYPHCRSMW